MTIPKPGLTPEEDNGQISILMIGMMLICLMALIVIMAITSVYLAERKLQAHADNAALAAADSFRGLELPDDGGGRPSAELTDASVNGSATAYLTEVGAEFDLDGLSVAAGTGTTDGRTAQVRLEAVAHPPVIAWIIPAGVPITATGDARAEFEQ
ncbi:pilus assembly protein TadG-related protein [Kocuria sp.]|uniref:pilus assembly protein TadG-related protein n=1 Tax=Kocuria sp. TaxID=1871328 RepID=UPI0026DEDD3E|nr:pilus assembly protein TadG-related protein [Kocuria sp.]MDO5619609.1 pilus assembly protein TadG-related protein [Kocuria sp.]